MFQLSALDDPDVSLKFALDRQYSGGVNSLRPAATFDTLKSQGTAHGAHSVVMKRGSLCERAELPATLKNFLNSKNGSYRDAFKKVMRPLTKLVLASFRQKRVFMRHDAKIGAFAVSVIKLEKMVRSKLKYRMWSLNGIRSTFNMSAAAKATCVSQVPPILTC